MIRVILRRVILGLILSFLVALFIGAISYEVGYFFHRGRIRAEYEVKVEIIEKRAELNKEKQYKNLTWEELLKREADLKKRDRD